MKLFERLENIKKAFILAYRMGKKNAACGNLHFPAEVVLGVPVFHMNELVEFAGGSICIVSKKDQNLWVDDYFFELSEEGKEFLVMHEQGHKLKGHLEKSTKELRQIMVERANNPAYVHPMEIEADAYAYEVLGYDKCIKALYEIADIQLRRGYSYVEIRERISILTQRRMNEIGRRLNY